MSVKSDLKLPAFDPVRRQAEKDSGGNEFSPMNPPEAYAPPKKEEVPFEALHPFLQELMKEHRACEKEIGLFEQALHLVPEKGIDREADAAFRRFFCYFDEVLLRHHRREEKILFPRLRQRLIENGEHSHGPEKTTAIEMFEEDHVKIVQLVSVIFNFFGLVARLSDSQSRLLVLDAALEQGKSLVELLRLHIFREDHILMPQAHRYCGFEDLEKMQKKGLFPI